MYPIHRTPGTSPVPGGQGSKLRGERGVRFPRQYVLERAAAGGCLHWLHVTAIPFGPQPRTANGIEGFVIPRDRCPADISGTWQLCVRVLQGSVMMSFSHRRPLRGAQARGGAPSREQA